MIKYRKANVADLEELIKLRISFIEEMDGKLDDDFKNKLTLSLIDYFKVSLSDDSFVAWIAEDDGVIVATSGISFYTTPPNHKVLNGKIGYILNMFTISGYRGKGIGTKIFEKVLAEASAKKVKKVHLHYTEQGRPLYDKFGFEEGQNEMFLFLSD